MSTAPGSSQLRGRSPGAAACSSMFVNLNPHRFPPAPMKALLAWPPALPAGRASRRSFHGTRQTASRSPFRRAGGQAAPRGLRHGSPCCGTRCVECPEYPSITPVRSVTSVTCEHTRAPVTTCQGTTTGATAGPQAGTAGPWHGWARPAATSSGLAGNAKPRPSGAGRRTHRCACSGVRDRAGCAWCRSCQALTLRHRPSPKAPGAPYGTRTPYGKRPPDSAAERASQMCAGPGQPIDRCHGRVRSRRRARHLPKLDFHDLGGYPQGHTHSARAYKPERNR